MTARGHPGAKESFAQRKLYVNEITHPGVCTSNSPRYHLDTWAFPFHRYLQ